VGNRTIGASALGGMLMGTLFGVIIVPGLYYIFAKLAEGKRLIKDEDLIPFTEEMIEHHTQATMLKKIQKLQLLLKVARRKKNQHED
jgi:HAE1 family hydrophobic/amphiphilic exporter-1